MGAVRSLIAAGLLSIVVGLSGCGRDVASDADLIAMLQADRTGFDQAVEDMSRPPAITEIRSESDGGFVDPATADPSRVERLRHFMDAHAIARISHYGARTRIVVSSSGPGLSGQEKSLVFEATGQIGEAGAGEPVADTDAVVADQAGSTLAYRSVGDGWFIRNSD